MAILDRRDMQYIYQDGDGYVFLDGDSLAPVTVPRDRVGDRRLFLKEGFPATVLFRDGQPVGLELPAAVQLVVTEAGPARPGAAAPARTAVVETGLTLTVPPFIQAGETIAIDTRTGAYVGRAGK